jgi:radical SAM-linked protein
MRRVLVKFSKKGEASFLSHRETMHSLERALRRSGLPLAFTSGYNPRPRMSFSPALPLGVAAEAEYLEVVLEGDVDAEKAGERINLALPAGLEVREVLPLLPTMPRLSRWARYGLYRVSGGEGETYLLLSLSGEKQGRLKDALERMATGVDGPAPVGEVTRVGLYASRDEVFEEARDPIYYYDGETRELERIAGE